MENPHAANAVDTVRINGEDFSPSGMVGRCPEMLNVFSVIRKIAASDIQALIVGESGTGKELVARAIHLNSRRRGGPFIAINCGAIPESLLEAELFGHEKGAFTGAGSMRHGKVEYASGGTLFLDEIAELPSGLQVKLLRFLQERTIQRVGGREDIRIDARIIAAANVEITKAIEDGAFREDLYYRIGVITINLPPLRERGDDLMLLANLFLRRFGEEFGKKARGFSVSGVEALRAHLWPGNVRELENRIKRAVVMSDSPIIEPRDLGFTYAPETQAAAQSEKTTLREARNRVERDLIIAAIERQRGNMARAAESLGISRPTLYDLMKKHGLYAPTCNGNGV